MGSAFMHRDDSKDNKRKGDLFETPYCLTEALLEREKFEGNILEPCAGNGAIVKVLKENYNFVTYSDKHYGDVIKDIYDYTIEDYDKATNIVSNFPYGSITDDMIMHCKSIYSGKMALLLRTNYLSGQKRLAQGVYDELKTVYVFNRMPDLRLPLREDGLVENTAGIVYSWFVYEKDYEGIPELGFLDISDKIAGEGRMVYCTTCKTPTPFHKQENSAFSCDNCGITIKGMKTLKEKTNE